jgi:hypothetical protein
MAEPMLDKESVEILVNNRPDDTEGEEEETPGTLLTDCMARTVSQRFVGRQG